MIDPTNVYYDVPMQVIYVDGARAIKSGIVYHEFLIDLSTGRAYTCQEILQKARDNGIDLDDAIIEYDDWRPLSYGK